MRCPPISFKGAPTKTLPKRYNMTTNNKTNDDVNAAHVVNEHGQVAPETLPETPTPTPTTDDAQKAMDEAFDAATESRYIAFKDKPVQIITFVNPGFKTTVGQNGEPQFEFDVIDQTGAQKLLSTQSARLMNALKKIYAVGHSLAGLKIKIVRTGEGYKTVYTAEAI